MKRFLLVSVLTLAGAACEQQSEHLTEPAGSEAPILTIRDAVHNSGARGFFFLPPIVAQPAYGGVFDASLDPVVTICVPTLTDCDPTIATFGTTSESGEEAVRLSLQDEHYAVNWHTDEYALSSSATYRIQISVGGFDLGYADVDVVDSGKELKNVDTGEFIALKDGRTLPIKFRLELGSVPAVGPAGGTVGDETGGVDLTVPTGALTETVVVLIDPSEGHPTVPGLVPGTAFEFAPEGLSFTSPAVLTVAYDEANLPAGVSEEDLRLHKLVAGEWFGVVGSSVDEGMNTVTGLIDGFSVYGIVAVAGEIVWAIESSGTTERLLEVWGSSRTDIYAAGDGAALLRSDGQSWILQGQSVLPPDFEFRGLSGIPGLTHDVIAGGASATIGSAVYHFNGAAWARLGGFPPGGNTNGAVRGLSDGYFGLIVGNQQNLEGRIWAPTSVNTIGLEWAGGQNTALLGAWGNSHDGTGFAVGLSELILHNDGSGWVQQHVSPGGTTLQSVWGAAVDDVIAVGENGVILRYDGTSWSAESSGTTSALMEVFGSASDDVYAVGVDATVLHYDGSVWTPIDVGVVADFFGVWVSAEGRTVYMVGTDGVIVSGQK